MNFLILPYFQHRGLENPKQPNLNRKTATSRLKKELFYFYRTAMVCSLWLHFAWGLKFIRHGGQACLPQAGLIFVIWS